MGLGRGLACLAIDCLYSLNGGRPGFTLRKFMQLKVWIYPEFSNKVSLGGKCLKFFI